MWIYTRTYQNMAVFHCNAQKRSSHKIQMVPFRKGGWGNNNIMCPHPCMREFHKCQFSLSLCLCLSPLLLLSFFPNVCLCRCGSVFARDRGPKENKLASVPSRGVGVEKRDRFPSSLVMRFPLPSCWYLGRAEVYI